MEIFDLIGQEIMVYYFLINLVSLLPLIQVADKRNVGLV